MDITLGGRIDSEKVVRAAADDALDDRIDSEAVVREAADDALGVRIDNLPEGLFDDNLASLVSSVQSVVNPGVINAVIGDNTYEDFVDTDADQEAYWLIVTSEFATAHRIDDITLIPDALGPVSYTHLTLPTKRIV